MSDVASLSRLFVLAAIWGASFLFTRIGATEFGSFAIVFLRTAIGGLFLLPILARREGLGALRRDAGALLLLGIVNSALPFALFAWSVTRIGAGTDSVLNATAPLWGALLGAVFQRERPTPTRIAGLALGFLGVLLLVRVRPHLADLDGAARAMDSAQELVAAAAALLATFLYAVGALYSRARFAGHGALVVSTGSQIGASLFLAPFAVFTWPDTPPSSKAWSAALAVGVLCTGIAYLLYFRLMKEGGPTRALAVTYLIPIFGLLWGALFLSEPVTPAMIGACAVILVGTILSSLPAGFTLRSRPTR